MSQSQTKEVPLSQTKHTTSAARKYTFKTYLTEENLVAMRRMADMLGKKSIGDYISHCVESYSAYILSVLEEEKKRISQETTADEVSL